MSGTTNANNAGKERVNLSVKIFNINRLPNSETTAMPPAGTNTAKVRYGAKYIL